MAKPATKSTSVTELIENFKQGRTGALEKLLELVYPELRRIAQKHMRRESPNHTLQPTALVHEVFVQMVAERKVDWQNRTHFFAAAAQMMRWVLLDHAKGKRRAKRGGNAVKVSFEENLHWVAKESDVDLVELNTALETLAKLDERRARVVELRFFGGLSIEEAAQVLGVSPNTVKRDWNLAKAWLFRELTEKKNRKAA